ncbi:MAG: IseA DL-endopeptidase inhibitor family protein [Clostridia bacterium]|nr:IseA DL-endopeptidase inhibitor family protein [Clostridia bacterium]
MKKYLLMLLLLLSVTVLTACNNTKEVTDEEKIEETIDEEKEGIPYPNAMPTSLKFGINELTADLSKDELSNEDILNAYLYADSISMFMNVCTLENVNYEDRIEITNPANGFVMDYYKSNDFNTYDDFKNYISKVFSKEMTEKLLTNESYQSYDDMLYILPAGRGTDIFALDDTYKIVKESDNKISFKVATGYIDEKSGKEPNEFADPDYYEYNNFDLEKLDEGWRFTSFPVIR